MGGACASEEEEEPESSKGDKIKGDAGRNDSRTDFGRPLSVDGTVSRSCLRDGKLALWALYSNGISLSSPTITGNESRLLRPAISAANLPAKEGDGGGNEAELAIDLGVAVGLRGLRAGIGGEIGEGGVVGECGGESSS